MKCEMINVHNERDEAGEKFIVEDPCVNEATHNNPDGDVKMCKACVKKMVAEGRGQDIKELEGSEVS